MSTITTEQDLSAVPEGSVIAVNDTGGSRNYTRTGERFVSGDYRLRTEDFRPLLEQGRVSLGLALCNGGIYASSDYYWIVVGERTEEGTWPCAWFSNYGSFYGLTDPDTLTGASQVTEVADRPEWMNTQVVEMARSLAAQRTSATVWRRRYEEQAMAQPRVEGLRHSRVEGALHEYMCDHDGLSSTEFDALNDVLVGLGLDRFEHEEDVEVEVSVSGEGHSYFDHESAELVGGNVNVDNPRFDFQWTWTGTITHTVANGSCACEQVDREDVAALMERDGVNLGSEHVDEWEYELTCSNG